MDGRVLADVEPAEVFAERDDLAAYGLDEAVGEGAGAVGAQRVGHDVEVGEQLVHRLVGGTGGGRRRDTDRLGRTGEGLLGAGEETAVHAPQRPAIRLVGAERRRVAGPRREVAEAGVGVISRSDIDSARPSSLRQPRRNS